MKILQVNCVYNKGSTGKIVYDIHTELVKNNVESVVCYGRGDKVNQPNVYKTCGELYSKANILFSRATGLMYGGLGCSTNRLIKIIKREKPTIVHLHCINGYFVNIYSIVTWLKKANIKTVLTLHAEFMYTANCGYSYECEKWKTGCGNCPRFKKETKSLFFDNTALSYKKMQKAFDGFDNLTVVSVSPWLMDRAKQSPILKDKNHKVVFNGLDTSVFYPRDVSELKVKHNIKDQRIVFFATPNFTNDKNNVKGGYYVLKLAQRFLGQNVLFFVAGPKTAEFEVPANMVLLGNVSNQEELAKYYSLADVTVLASRRETFSMVVAESLCCGTPVVGFKAGGPEQIAIAEFSTFVEHGDLDGMYNAVLTFLNGINVDAEKAQQLYSRSNMIANYIKVYKEV